MQRQEITRRVEFLSRVPPAGICAIDNTPQYDPAKMTMVRPIRSFNHRRSARDRLQGEPCVHDRVPVKPPLLLTSHKMI
jgi:hypothetical protein